jgi:hypothetical protein
MNEELQEEPVQQKVKVHQQQDEESKHYSFPPSSLYPKKKFDPKIVRSIKDDDTEFLQPLLSQGAD